MKLRQRVYICTALFIFGIPTLLYYITFYGRRTSSLTVASYLAIPFLGISRETAARDSNTFSEEVFDERSEGEPLKYVQDTVFHAETFFMSIKEQYRMVSVVSALPQHEAEKLANNKSNSKSSLSDDASKLPLKVFLVPHSHNDPGWLLTVEQYYLRQTKSILDNMLESLLKYPDLTFIWSETSLLSRWWKDISTDSKDKVRMIVKRGQLEIVTGGWVMPDEASTHYESVIMQLIQGHLWVQKHLGVTPKINWSVDPFGHSGSLAYLWKLAGYSHMVIGRIHSKVKEQMSKYKVFQFSWRQPWDGSGSTSLFTHTLSSSTYVTIDTCGPVREYCANLMYDANLLARITNEREQQKHTDNLYANFKAMSMWFRYGVILVPLGADFSGVRKDEWVYMHTLYTKLMTQMNSDSRKNIEVKFGTLSDYFAAVDERTREMATVSEPPEIQGDFLSYSDSPGLYWTGYFTSRPSEKGISRELQANLKAAEMLNVFAIAVSLKNKPKTHDISEYLSRTSVMLDTAREALALFQHHDAITGTSRPKVVVDYRSRLLTGFKSTQSVIQNASALLIENIAHSSSFSHLPIEAYVYSGLQMRRSVKILTFNKSNSHFLVFNPSNIQRTEIVRLMSSRINVHFSDSSGNSLPVQWRHVHDHKFANGQQVSILYEAALLIRLPPFSISQISANVDSKQTDINKKEPRMIEEVIDKQDADISLENSCIKASFSPSTGMLKYLIDKRKGRQHSVSIDFASYTPYLDGAYLFNSNGDASSVLEQKPVSVHFLKGALVSYIEIKHAHFTHRVEVHNVTDVMCHAIHIQNVVHLQDNNMELIMRFKTDIQNKNQLLYTDSNGIQIVPRNFYSNLPKSANYYPMTNMAFIQDHATRLTLHSAQPLGVSSYSSGWLEVMLDRAIVSDDHKGLDMGIFINTLQHAHSRFSITIEDMTDMSRELFMQNVYINGPDKIPYTHPTLHSLHVNSVLQHPPIIVHYTGAATVPIDTVRVLTSLPCDVELVMLRQMEVSENEQHNTALIVHRRLYIKKKSLDTACQLASKTMNLARLFTLSNSSSSVTEMSLSFMHSHKIFPADTNISLKPMDLQSYHLQWT